MAQGGEKENSLRKEERENKGTGEREKNGLK